MRSQAGALCARARSEGFVVLMPPPDGEIGAVPDFLCGQTADPAFLGAAQVGSIRCWRLVTEAALPLSPSAGEVLLLYTPNVGEMVLLGGTGAQEPLMLPAGQERFIFILPRALLEVAVRSKLPDAPPPHRWPARVVMPVGGACTLFAGYVVRMIGECDGATAQGDIGRQLEELLVLEVLRNWIGMGEGAVRPVAVPRHVRLAEVYMETHAARSPAIAEVAQAAGVSERVLSTAFGQFRGMTPSAHLRALRLGGVRAALEQAGEGETVASIAAAWGYANFGLFARAYANRFGELPSVTLRRARKGAG